MGGKGKSLFDAEERESGKVEWDIYEWYAGHVGWPILSLMVFFTCLQAYFPVFGLFIISEWTNKAAEDPLFDDHSYYVNLYVTMLACGFVANAVWAIASAEGRAIASASIHKLLTYSVARVPVAFFDVTPLGRILNRFSKDIQSV